jgi:hypothetical protein
MGTDTLLQQKQCQAQNRDRKIKNQASQDNKAPTVCAIAMILQSFIDV